MVYVLVFAFCYRCWSGIQSFCGGLYVEEREK